MSFVTNPQDEPRPAEAESLPGEEAVDAADVEERLDEAPEEAHNRTDGYAPADDPEDPVDSAD